MSEIDEIRSVIADVERGFNAHDATLANEHVVPGVSVAIEVRPDQHAWFEVRDVTLLRPDVALVDVEVHGITEDGEPLDLDHTMSSLYVLVKQRQRWWIAARQSTLVPT
jgi:hypothetical protein